MLLQLKYRIKVIHSKSADYAECSVIGSVILLQYNVGGTLLLELVEVQLILPAS